ncbi:uncharacterized protein YigE (DUF2233 family) [Roseovarius sp. MBR-79]
MWRGKGPGLRQARVIVRLDRAISWVGLWPEMLRSSRSMTGTGGTGPRALASALLAALVLLAPLPAAAFCRAITFEGAGYTLCGADAARDDIRLFLNDPTRDTPLGSFANIDRQLKPEGKRLAFAMNGGMYHADRRPVGLHVEAGQEIAPLVTSAGPGNFGMLPNGVFCVTGTTAHVIETRRFAREAPTCRFATQSGPMLVIDGALHPRFLEESGSRHIRNGVGTSADGRRVWFLISDAPVNFHRFARVFRDHLGAPQALYLDGKVSRLHAPGLARSDLGFPLGPMVGVVVDGGTALD